MPKKTRLLKPSTMSQIHHCQLQAAPLNIPTHWMAF